MPVGHPKVERRRSRPPAVVSSRLPRLGGVVHWFLYPHPPWLSLWIYRSCGPAAALPRQQLSRGSAPRRSTPTPVLSFARLFKRRSGQADASTGRSGRGATGGDAFCSERCVPGRCPPACLPADGFACGGTARHGHGCHIRRQDIEPFCLRAGPAGRLHFPSSGLLARARPAYRRRPASS